MIPHRLYRALQALVMVLLGLFLVDKLVDGSLLWYVGARFLPLTLIGVLGLIWMAQTLLSELRHETAQPDAAVYPIQARSGTSPAAVLILALPFLLGLLFPARPLGSSAVNNQGISTLAPRRPASSDAAAQPAPPPADRTVLDWLRVFSQSPDPSAYQGELAEVIGFVYHDPRLPADQFLLVRFAVSCCVVDATALGVIVSWPGADQLPADAWLQVRGPVRVGQLAGGVIPLIQAEALESVPEPAQPYLFN